MVVVDRVKAGLVDVCVQILLRCKFGECAVEAEGRGLNCSLRDRPTGPHWLGEDWLVGQARRRVGD